ncbi:MAG: hypothetical protein QOD69_868 [Solirubrobacteraceae bacterium]|nr:hypothetical protein [Solirubrobacteraceae bacterium]
MPVAPAAVWDALADPGGYADWVVGSRRIRDADPTWPAPGSRFHHTVGLGPLTVDDHTESLEAEAPRRLRMRARARPLGSADVTMELTPEVGGTLVRMTEDPAGPLAVLSLNPFFQLATKARNAESLKRLELLALRRAR